MDKNLTKNQENYLNAIFELLQKNEDIKVKDVSKYLNIKGPSTADAVKLLKEKGYINYEPYKNITLTTKGMNKIAVKKYRNKTIKNFLINILELDEKMAANCSENIEYTMPEVVLEKFVHFLDFASQCTCKEPKWMKSCKTALQEGKISEKCQNCISSKEKSCCCGCS